jgi:hypothetical protein
MSLHSGNMRISVPDGNPATADSIHFVMRPYLAQRGIQSWGLTKQVSSSLYTFAIEVEGAQWSDIERTLNSAQSDLLSTYGVHIVS